jgi:hypothetical protein
MLKKFVLIKKRLEKIEESFKTIFETGKIRYRQHRTKSKNTKYTTQKTNEHHQKTGSESRC